MSPSEGNIFCQVNKSARLSTVVDYKSKIIVSKVQEHLNFLLLCQDRPLGYGFECGGIHLDLLTIDNMH